MLNISTTSLQTSYKSYQAKSMDGVIKKKRCLYAEIISSDAAWFHCEQGGAFLHQDSELSLSLETLELLSWAVKSETQSYGLYGGAFNL